MTHTHLKLDKHLMIESYFKISESVANVARLLERLRQTSNKFYQCFEQQKTALK